MDARGEMETPLKVHDYSSIDSRNAGMSRGPIPSTAANETATRSPSFDGSHQQGMERYIGLRVFWMTDRFEFRNALLAAKRLGSSDFSDPPIELSPTSPEAPSDGGGRGGSGGSGDGETEAASGGGGRVGARSELGAGADGDRGPGLRWVFCIWTGRVR